MEVLISGLSVGVGSVISEREVVIEFVCRFGEEARIVSGADVDIPFILSSFTRNNPCDESVYKLIIEA